MLQWRWPHENHLPPKRVGERRLHCQPCGVVTLHTAHPEQHHAGGKGNELRISGTNLQMRIDCRIQAQVESPGAITVPAKLFWEIVSRLAGEHVALDVNPRTLMLAIGCGNYKAKINGLSAEDFPVPPKDDVLAVVTIKAGVLRQMIDQTAFAASTDMSRQNITGVEFVISGSRLGMAATDGYRLGAPVRLMSLPHRRA